MTFRRFDVLTFRRDREVAVVVARYTGASLGLLAFTITTAVGLLVRNPVEVTLSRGTVAMFAFCTIGLLLGTAAQMVVAEHEKKRESEIRKRYREGPADKDEDGREPGPGKTEVSR